MVRARVTRYELARKKVIPKGCTVARVTFNKAGEADVGLRCGETLGPGVMGAAGGLSFAPNRLEPEPTGKILARGEPAGTYPSITLRGIHGVKVDGVSVGVETGEATVIMPFHQKVIVCERDQTTLKCHTRER